MKKKPFFQQEMTVKHIILVATLVILVVVAVVFTSVQDRGDIGKMVFRRNTDDRDGTYEILVVNPDKTDQFISLGRHRGVPSLSSDGNYLAISCLDHFDRICILDIRRVNIEDQARDTEKQLSPYAVRVVELPGRCRNVLSSIGVESISWSYDDSKLAVVCSKDFSSKDRETCIVPIDESEPSVCWSLPIPYHISRAEWSPIDDKLVISSTSGYGSKIFVVDSYGKAPIFLTEGWGAAWSPDGKQIAFMQWQDKYYSWENGRAVLDPNVKVTYAGLAMINSDGTNLHWIYRNPGSEFAKIPQISFGCDGEANVCNATWSPNGNEIAFSGSSMGMYNFYIYKIDLNTGEISYITPPGRENSRFNSVPDWSR